MRAPISIVIEAGGGLGLVLDSLGEGLAEGLIREVWLAGSVSAADDALAEAAGVEQAADMAAAMRAIRGDWLVLVPSGTGLQDGWTAVALGCLRGGGAGCLLPATGADVWMLRR